MPTPDPNSYAEQWVQAWNAHDIEAVLDHFSDDVVFTSPVAARVVSESGEWCARATARTSTDRTRKPTHGRESASGSGFFVDVGAAVRTSVRP